MVNELKPCAHCGAKPFLCGIDGSASKNFVMCIASEVQTGYHKTDAKAAAAWNTRADTGRLSELEAEVARLREALEPFAKIGSWLGRTPAGRSLSLIGLVVESDGINSNGRYAMKSGDFLSARAALEAQS